MNSGEEEKEEEKHVLEGGFCLQGRLPNRDLFLNLTKLVCCLNLRNFLAESLEGKLVCRIKKQKRSSQSRSSGSRLLVAVGVFLLLYAANATWLLGNMQSTFLADCGRKIPTFTQLRKTSLRFPCSLH